MKILHVNEHLALKGGVETYMLSLIPRLTAMGHEQVVAFAQGDAEVDCRTHHLPSVSDARLSAFESGRREMAEIMRRERPDVVHVHNIHNVGTIAAALQHAPTVIHAHDYRYICPSSSLYYRREREVCDRTCGVGCFVNAWTRRCMTPRPAPAIRSYRRVRWMMANAGRIAQVIAPSEYAARRYAAAGFADRVSVAPYFCSIEPLAQPRPLPVQPLVTFMGRLSANKGVDVFVEALGQMHGDVRGLIVGNVTVEAEARIRSWAERAGCSQRLEVRPWAGRDEVPRVLSHTSVLVFPSTWAETLGIIGLEAMACGVPVVASDIGGVRQWLRHEENGLLVAPKDTIGLAAAVQTILDDAPMALRMGEEGIRTIQRQFLPSTHLDQLLAVYRGAASVAAPVDARPILT